MFKNQEDIVDNMMKENKRRDEEEEYLRKQAEGEDLLHRAQNDESDQLRDMSDARKMQSDLEKEESDARFEDFSNLGDHINGLVGQIFD